MVYCFDTDVLSRLARPRPPLPLIRRLAVLDPQHQATTAISAAELLFGLEREPMPARDVRLRALVEGLRVIPFDRRAAVDYAQLKAQLERESRTLAEPDLRIAAIVRARGLTLVTGNVRHFERVPGLVVENWLED